MPNERDLMRRVSAKDAAAFDELVVAVGPWVRLRLVGIVRDEAAADDLLQEVLLRVWTRSGQWDGRGDVRAWLGRMAVNLALNHLRARRRQRHVPLEPSVDPDKSEPSPAWMVDVSAVAPDLAAESNEEAARLAELLAGLPPTKLDVLRLVYEQELELHEAARLLGLPVGTVKSRLFYARRELARRWEQRDDNA